MKSIQIDAGRWRCGDTARIGVFSDPHIEINGDNDALKQALDKAVSMGCRLCFNGDLSDFIYHPDKRYVPEREESPGLNPKLDLAVDYIVEFLWPYKDHIDFIGYGNHETVAIKKYLTDPIRRVCNRLGCEPGAYRALVRYVWHHEGDGTRSFTVYYHHGGKGVATQNKGILALREMYLGAEADCYVVGHGHRSSVDAGEPRYYMDRLGNVKMKVRKGMQVPGFQGVDSPTGTGFGDRFYRPTPRGWGLIEITFKRQWLSFDLVVKVD